MFFRFHSILMLCVFCLVASLGGNRQSGGNSIASSASERILFQSNRDGNWEVYTMRTDGSQQVNLSRHPADDTQPSLSPDGRRIVFVSNRDVNSEIYVMTSSS